VTVTAMRNSIIVKARLLSFAFVIMGACIRFT
jgi:hypothetical protein